MKIYFVVLSAAVISLASCSKTSTTAASDGTTSTIAAGSIGGSSNDDANGGSSSYALIPREKTTILNRIENAFNLLPEAFAVTLTCTGGSMSPSSYAANTSFHLTPISCTLAYKNGKSAGVTWSSYFNLNYGSTCTGTGFKLNTQTNTCVVTRTTPSGGNTRTQTRLNGVAHAVTVDTTTPSGWDTTVTTASTGHVATATAAQFASRTIAIGGTHLTSTLDGAKNWDHTISTLATAPLVFSGTGASKTMTSGTLIVQHNLAKFTAATSVATTLAFTNTSCCFPTSGALTTTFTGGTQDGKTETITFSSDCGEATLVDSNGASSSVTLNDCL